MVTTLDPNGSTTVVQNLPPGDGGPFATGPGATDPNDPQQGQQPIGFTHQILGPTSPSDPTTSLSDMPNTAHLQGSPDPTQATPSPPAPTAGPPTTGTSSHHSDGRD
jgi:hypothetical protein